MRTRSALLTLGAAAALTVPLTATAALADSHGGGGAAVTVVHGIPGTPVDVWVDGSPALQGFQPGATTTVQLSGSTQVTIVPAGGQPADAVIDENVDVPASGSVDLVAHLSEAGQPDLTAFPNGGSDNVVVRHTAAAPAVDVLVDGAAALEGLTNPNEASATLDPGSYQVAVALAGTTDPVLGPITLDAQAGTTYTAYAYGSAEDSTLDVLVLTDADRALPSSVDAGSGGLAADGTAVLLPLLVVGGLLLTGGAVALARR